MLDAPLHSTAKAEQVAHRDAAAAALSTSASASTSSDGEDARLAEAALIERRKMLAGEPYNAMFDQDLLEGRLRARKLLHEYNHFPPPAYVKGMAGNDFFGPDERFGILAELFDIPLKKAKALGIEPPLYVDYGTNIKFKGDFYANFGLTVLDCAQVTFGERVLVAPSVQIYAATHSVDVAERVAGLERAYPVSIGDDCWLGGGAIFIGPCSIGKNCTVAAGAVVRGTFPDNVVIGGTPARILKHLEVTA